MHGEIKVKDRKSSQEYRIQLMGVSGFTRELPEFVSKSENGQNQSSTKARIRS